MQEQRTAWVGARCECGSRRIHLALDLQTIAALRPYSRLNLSRERSAASMSLTDRGYLRTPYRMQVLHNGPLLLARGLSRRFGWRLNARVRFTF